MNRVQPKEWYEANQHYIMASLRSVQEELELYKNSLDESDLNSKLLKPKSANPKVTLTIDNWDFSTPPALQTLEHVFRLTTFESKLLLMCAGVELDARFGSLLADLNGEASAMYPSFSLALAVLPDASWDAISPDAPLRHWGLVKLNTGGAITKSALKIDENILHYLTGVFYMEERLRELLVKVVTDAYLAPSQVELVEHIRFVYTSKTDTIRLPIVHLTGENQSDKTNIAAAVCAGIGFDLYNLSIHSIPTNSKEVTELARLWNREAALKSYALLLDCSSVDVNDKSRLQSVTHFIENILGVLILIGNEWSPNLNRQKVEFKVEKPTREEQLSQWTRNLKVDTVELNGELDQVVAQFNLSAKTIDAASEKILSHPTASREAEPTVWAKEIWKTCCQYTRPKIDELAQRIESMTTLDDLVLPIAQKQVLIQIAQQVKNRNKVYQDWGFAAIGARGLGISALFTGESGTGKTMASEALANELQLDLYRIDLSQVVNKYIGETEKNLKRIFDAAEEGGSILLFDEADALFGKRSDVKDSHDRYSNIEVSYLLQRMEAYRGLAILTTNMKSAIDRAFLRRIRFVVQFPYPDANHRAEIWKRAFPGNTPIENLDMEKLAKLNVSGGNIRNIALNAAFIAAGENKPVQMTHLLRAAVSEYAKLEKSLSNSEIGGWQ